jgi:hypothetical protein
MTEPLVYRAVVNRTPASRATVNGRSEFFILSPEGHNNKLKQQIPTRPKPGLRRLLNLAVVLLSPTTDLVGPHQACNVGGCHVG